MIAKTVIKFDITKLIKKILENVTKNWQWKLRKATARGYTIEVNG